jgi:PAS domain S-box-containing protein
MADNKIKILLVEDNPGDVRLIEEMIKEAGASQFNLSVEGSLDGALGCLRKESFEGVMLDLNLPDSQGLATLKSIQGNFSRVAVIVITGLDDEAIAIESQRIGAEDFLIKGKFDSFLLVRSLRYAIERKKAKEALHKSEERLRFALETSNVGAWDLDLIDQTAVRSIEHDRIFGYTELPPKWSYETFMEHVLPEDREAVNLKFRNALENKTDWNFECRIRRIDGLVRWIWATGRHQLDVSGKAQRMAGIMQDITDRKQMEHVLPEDREAVNLKFRNALENKTDWNFECRIRRIDGLVRWIWATGRHQLDVSGKAQRMAGIMQDITDRKQMEQKLNEAYQQIITRTKDLEMINENLDSFAYSVSHDLRAPLRAISGFSQVLLDTQGDKVNEEMRHYLNRISEGAKKMGQLIDDLLGFSRATRSEIKYEKINVENIVNDLVKAYRDVELDRDIEFIVNPLGEVEADKEMLKVVFSNLLQNAVKFTIDREKARIEIGSEQKEDHIQFYVKDNGIGFDMRYKDKLFKAFQRLHTDERFTGTGIGLTTVKRIVSKHGGNIWAKGEVDKGAEFYFTLPSKTHVK